MREQDDMTFSDENQLLFLIATTSGLRFNHVDNVRFLKKILVIIKTFDACS